MDNNGLSKSADYDVVILGAGVAGLLLAAELSRSVRVLVLEKNNRTTATKYWVTTQEALTSNSHLAHAADMAFTSMDFIAYDGTTYRCAGDYQLWNTAALTDFLLQQTLDGGSSVLFGHTFYSYLRSRDGITVLANDRSIRAKLVVDCMGYQSPIVMAEGCGTVLGYYLLYGATFRMMGGLAPIALHNLALSAHAVYVEAFPTSDGQLHIVAILPVRQLRPASDLRAEFEFIVRKSPYSRHIADARDRQFLGGIIPVFRMRRRARDRVFLYGEAGQVHPAATGTALTRMMLHHRAVAAFLVDSLRTDRLDARHLERSPGSMSGANQAIQLALFRDILRWSSRRFRDIVVEANRLDDDMLINQLFFGDFDSSPKGLARIGRRLAKARNWTLLSAVTSGVFRSITT